MLYITILIDVDVVVVVENDYDDHDMVSPKNIDMSTISSTWKCVGNHASMFFPIPKLESTWNNRHPKISLIKLESCLFFKKNHILVPDIKCPIMNKYQISLLIVYIQILWDCSAMILLGFSNHRWKGISSSLEFHSSPFGPKKEEQKRHPRCFGPSIHPLHSISTLDSFSYSFSS